MAAEDRDRGHLRARLTAARLYLVCDATPGGRPLEAVVGPALEGGVDMVQLRDKRLDDAALVDAGVRARRVCHAAGALFVLNDRPDLAVAADADGVHLGQDDMPVDEARAIVGEGCLIGLSTHSPAQVDAARGVDYIAVGPVHPTPTKPGRPAVGHDLLRYASAHARLPFFAIGGIDATTLPGALAAGAARIVVVRVIAHADDPRAAARQLREMLEAPAQPAGALRG